MKTNYILIDYENVQPADISILEQEHFRIRVFLGAKQEKVSFEIASTLQRMGIRAAYVKAAGTGPNALDFHLAFYLGQLVYQEADAYFHIISKDTGFDPLIQHLREQKVRISRSKSIQDIPLLRIALASSFDERLDAIQANLQQRGQARPRTLKTLSSTINTLLQKGLSEEEIQMLVNALQKRKVITITETKVAYHFPSE
jgi:hypothetical protein